MVDSYKETQNMDRYTMILGYYMENPGRIENNSELLDQAIDEIDKEMDSLGFPEDVKLDFYEEFDPVINWRKYVN